MSGNNHRGRDVEWADVLSKTNEGLINKGIRGIASLFIVTSHTVWAFLPNYLSPADDVDATPHLFQRPFFRIIASGPFWVSIFFLLSGYVCAIKPLRLASAGQHEEARKVVASCAFRRLVRIGIPAFFGTLFPWTMVQLGAFKLVPEIDQWEGWLVWTRPPRIKGVFAAVYNLFFQAVCLLLHM